MPVKPPFKKAVREVELKLQRGQLISEAIGDVDGDGKEEVVDLLGNPVVEKSSFMGDLYIVVKEVGKKDVKYFIRPQNLGGYDPYLMLADVTGSGAPNVIVAVLRAARAVWWISVSLILPGRNRMKSLPLPITGVSRL